MSSNSTDCTDFFTQNTDITGIGVRVGFYLQVAIISVQILLREREAYGARWTLVSMSFGLMITSIISASQGQLSYFNALPIQNLVLLVNVTLAQVELARLLVWWNYPSEFEGAKSRDRTLTWFSYSQMILAFALFIALWAHGRDFGPDSECISSMLFYPEEQLVKGDHFTNEKVSILLAFIGLIVCPVILVQLFWQCLQDAGIARGMDCERRMPTLEEVASHRTKSRLERAKRQKRAKRKFKVIGYIIYFVHWVSALCAFVLPIELSLRQRLPSADDASAWSFGQVFALVAVVPSFAALLLTIGDFIKERRELKGLASRRPRADEGLYDAITPGEK